MFNLLKSDFYRALRSVSLWVCLGLLVVVIATVAFGMNWLCSPEFAQMVQSTLTEENLADMTDEEKAQTRADAQEALAEAQTLNAKELASPTDLWANVFVDGGLLGLLGSMFVALFLAQDFKSGFARNLPMDRRGRLSYFGEKLLFAAIVQALFLAVAVVAASGLFGALGFSYLSADSVGGVALWLLLTWLVACAYAFIVAWLVWLLRTDTVGVVAAIMVSTGAAGAIAAYLLTYFSRGIAWLGAVPPWMLVSAFTDLRHGAAGLFEGTPIPALPLVNPTGQVLLLCSIYIALSLVIVFAACRKRDIK